MSVCVQKDMPVEQIEHLANVEHPTGIQSQWMKSSDKTFSDGVNPNPCPCPDHPETRLHYLLEC